MTIIAIVVAYPIAGVVYVMGDIGGRHMLRFNGSPHGRNALVRRLEMLRCDLDRDGGDWLNVGTFVPIAIAKKAKKAKRTH